MARIGWGKSLPLLLPIRVLGRAGLPGLGLTGLGVSFVASQSGAVLSLVIRIGVDKQAWQSVPSLFGSSVNDSSPLWRAPTTASRCSAQQCGWVCIRALRWALFFLF